MKILTKNLLVFAFVIVSLLSFINQANAQTRPTVPPLVPDSVTGCTGYEMTAQCRPEWADSVFKCQVGTLGLGGANTCVTVDESVKSISPYVMVCSSTYQTAGCIPYKVNIYAAKNLANQAQIMLRSAGYTASCSTETLGTAGYVNPINNLTYGLFTSCTVNGHSGFDAYTLVNDPARDQSYTNWDVLATELKSIKAAETCGPTKIVFWNSDGSYKCIDSPHYTPPTTTPACGLTATCGTIIIANTINTANTTTSTINLNIPSSSTYNNNWYYKDLSYSSVDDEDPLISVQSTDPTTECTGYETTANCHPEWNRTTSICNASLMTGACRPERVNPYAAASIAKRAAALGKQKGYATFCSARYVPFRPGIDPDTGLTYYYSIKCTVNGTTGIDAESMLSNSAWETQVGKPNTATRPTTPTGTTNIINSSSVNSTTPACGLTATCGRLQTTALLQPQIILESRVRTLPPYPINNTPPTTIPPLVLDPITGCTGFENEARCRPEWADSVSRCQVGSLNTGGPNTCVTTDAAVRVVAPFVQVCSSTYQIGSCTPLRANLNAAKNIANQAETLGKYFGYTITCPVQALGAAGYVNPASNLLYGLYTICTVNGFHGFEASELSKATNISDWQGINVTLRNHEMYKACGEGANFNFHLNPDETYQCVISSQSTTTPGQTQTFFNPSVGLILDNGGKSGTFSVGDMINYQVKIQNVDSVSSYYTATPGDTCVGGSNSGEQKPWVFKTVSPLNLSNTLSAKVEQCQSGATYTITLVGTNKSLGKTVTSSVSVYIKK
ncbi:MAG: hypothetical protein WC884_02930 [Candidatus Paceibacterota bacterium]